MNNTEETVGSSSCSLFNVCLIQVIVVLICNDRFQLRDEYEAGFFILPWHISKFVVTSPDS